MLPMDVVYQEVCHLLNVIYECCLSRDISSVECCLWMLFIKRKKKSVTFNGEEV